MTKRVVFQKGAATRVNKILSDIDKLTKYSIGKEYQEDDIKKINQAIRKAADRLSKTLLIVEDATEFDFGGESSEEPQNTSDEIRDSQQNIMDY